MAMHFTRVLHNYTRPIRNIRLYSVRIVPCYQYLVSQDHFRTLNFFHRYSDIDLEKMRSRKQRGLFNRKKIENTIFLNLGFVKENDKHE